MKNKNLVLKFIKRFAVDLLVVMIAVLTVASKSTFHGELAEAEEFANSSGIDNQTYPYTRTFTISAYYSPLPCQNRYATGSYEGDIRLNGSGVNGADGTPVYPGMIAAPRSYAFSTKMDIPGVGIVAVHDRGGAIRASDGVPGVYDRLDVWMGYGDKGLTRALNWGKRTIEVVVYGINDGISEQIVLENYTHDEATHNQCLMPSPQEPSQFKEKSIVKKAGSSQDIPTVKTQKVLETDLRLGSSGTHVRQLQEELKRLNYFRTNITGYYGEVTEHSVFKFQQSQRLVGNLDSPGAGIFGPKTRDRLNEIVLSRGYTMVKMAEATNEYSKIMTAMEDRQRILAQELYFGMVGPEVSALQRFLKTRGYFKGGLITDYYGPVTKQAVTDFQLSNGIIKAESDFGAGYVGSETLELINSIS